MKTALITTTINVPRVLELYRAFDKDVRFFVAGDMKTPHIETEELCDKIGNCGFISQLVQTTKNYKCSPLLGWNTDSRRNIALIEAFKWGAEIIVSVDDDMIPQPGMFYQLKHTFGTPFYGLKFGARQQWLDAGNFTMPAARQRGLPVDIAVDPGFPESIIGANIGVVQGIILGVPDTGAAEAITNTPVIHSATDILRSGFVVHPRAYAVFNSQFTAFRAELAPAFAQFYKWQGRNTDILASLLMRRIMADRDLYTCFGPPMAFHARTPRPLLPDLKAEMYGLEHIQDFADYLRRAPIAGKSVIEDCRALMEGYLAGDSTGLLEAMQAWYDDCESVL